MPLTGWLASCSHRVSWAPPWALSCFLFLVFVLRSLDGSPTPSFSHPRRTLFSSPRSPSLFSQASLTAPPTHTHTHTHRCACTHTHTHTHTKASFSLAHTPEHDGNHSHISYRLSTSLSRLSCTFRSLGQEG